MKVFDFRGKTTGEIKGQTIGEVLSQPPLIRTSKVLERMERNVKAFDEYERREAYSVCNHCPELAKYHKESELFWDDECGYLCMDCLKEEEEARDIIAEEERNHHK